ncbi:hypothetical protein PMAYCL1PPCAC_05840, partial [Pristionchus mayeri]
VVVTSWLVAAAAAADAEDTPQITPMKDESEQSKEDLEKVKETLKELNKMVEKKIKENDDEDHKLLKEVMAIDLGPKSNETTVETDNKAGNVIGGDIALNPQQAAALVKGTRKKREEGIEDAIATNVEGNEQARIKRASLFDIPQFVSSLAKEFEDFVQAPLASPQTSSKVEKGIPMHDEANAIEADSPSDPPVVLRAKRGYQTNPKYAWDPTKPIPYFFDPAFPQSRIPAVRQGIAFWQNNTCLDFVEDANGD